MARSWSDAVRATTCSLFYASLQTVKAQSRRRAAAAAAAAAAAGPPVWLMKDANRDAQKLLNAGCNNLR